MSPSRVIHVLVSYLLVAVVIYVVKYQMRVEVPISVTMTDSSYVPGKENYLCWLSPDIGTFDYHTIASIAPVGCDALRPGFVTDTFVGHQFLVVYNNKTVTSPPSIVTVQSSISRFDIAEGNINYDRTKNFDLLVEWQQLLLYRRHVATAAAILLLSWLILQSDSFANTSAGSIPKSKPTQLKISTNTIPWKPQETIVSRHWLKFYAVIAMILNHCGYVFLQSNLPLQTWFTIFADAGGSVHVFNWLVGYNTTPTTTSSSVHLLIAFLFLNVCIQLPRPITYETLLSISLVRLFMQHSFMVVRSDVNNSDDSTGIRCAVVNAPLYQHALLCSAIVLLGPILGTEGVKILNTNAVLYAVCGRLFALSNEVGMEVRLLWIGAAVTLTLLSAAHNFGTVHRESGQQWLYGGVYAVLTLCSALLLNWPKSEGKSRSADGSGDVPFLVRWVAHYSLEIYVVHFLVLKTWEMYAA